jgi:hypothetical protein
MRTSKGSAIVGEGFGGIGGKLWDLVMFGSYAELQFGYVPEWLVMLAVNSQIVGGVATAVAVRARYFSTSHLRPRSLCIGSI